jgi:hypothetical protein
LRSTPPSIPARVTGITSSNEQLALARAGRASEKDLGCAVEFRLRDYRDVAEKFDRLVSVGMFEHVGWRANDRWRRSQIPSGIVTPLRDALLPRCRRQDRCFFLSRTNSTPVIAGETRQFISIAA